MDIVEEEHDRTFRRGHGPEQFEHGLPCAVLELALVRAFRPLALPQNLCELGCHRDEDGGVRSETFPDQPSMCLQGRRWLGEQQPPQQAKGRVQASREVPCDLVGLAGQEPSAAPGDERAQRVDQRRLADAWAAADQDDAAGGRSVHEIVRRPADCVDRFRQDRDLGRAADQPCGSGQAAREVPLSQREARCRFRRDAGEVVGKAAGGLVAAVGFLLEEPADHCAERGWHRRRELRERGRLARQDVSHQFERVDLGERRPSGRSFVQHGAERVEVGSTVDGRPGAPGLLR